MAQKTFLLLRCTTLKYAKAFLDTGNLRFGKPIEWIKEASVNGEGRGDYLEGSFAGCQESNQSFIDFIQSHTSDSTYKIINNRCFFHREKVLDLRTFCLFGINDDSFPSRDWNAQHKILPSGTIPLNYFQDFYKGITESEYDALPDNKKPVVIMINNPHGFFERIRKFFINMGVDEKSILISPVTYIDMSTEFIIDAAPPAELFFKSERFSNQSEIRIVIATSDDNIIKKIDDCNGIFNIGNMSDIAEIYDYYFHDMTMQIDGNEFYFTLPKPEDVKVTDPKTWIGYIMIALADEMPECQTLDETEKYISDICDTLEREYGFKCDREKYLFTDTSTGQTYSPLWSHICNVLVSHAYSHYIEGDYEKALDLYSRAIKYSPEKAQHWFDRGCCYCKLNNPQAAIKDMQKAIELDPDNTSYKNDLESYLLHLNIPPSKLGDTEQ